MPEIREVIVGASENGSRTKNSVYRKQSISNVTGIDQIEARDRLKIFALERPREYAAERSKVYLAVVKAMVEKNAKTLWDFLGDGVLPSGEKIMIGGKQWNGGLPDSDIASSVNGFCTSVKKAFEELLKDVMPDDYTTLAEMKTIHNARVEGALRV